MRYKHAFINASPLACAEPGESQRSLVSPLQPCRITTGGFKGKRWTGLNGPEGWQLSRVCSAKHRISFPADRVAAGEKETPEFFTDAPGDGCIGKTTEGNTMNKVIHITVRGELQVFADADLNACIREANRLNAERGLTSGVCVVELEDGHRMTAADCKAAA